MNGTHQSNGIFDPFACLSSQTFLTAKCNASAARVEQEWSQHYILCKFFEQKLIGLICNLNCNCIRLAAVRFRTSRTWVRTGPGPEGQVQVRKIIDFGGPGPGPAGPGGYW